MRVLVHRARGWRFSQPMTTQNGSPEVNTSSDALRTGVHPSTESSTKSHLTSAAPRATPGPVRGVALGDSILADREMMRRQAISLLEGRTSTLSRCGTLSDTQASVGVYRHAGGHLAFEGVHYCSRVWICPVCSRIVIRRRQRYLLALWASVKANGGRCATFCLTAGFPDVLTLAERLQRLTTAFSHLTSDRQSFGRRWRGVGYLGYSLTVENLYNDSSEHWQPHLHGTVFFQSTVPCEFPEWLSKSWKNAIDREGLSGGTHSLDHEFDDESAAVAYACKPIPDEEPTDSARLSPFQVLRASMTGEVRYIDAFREYAAATEGILQLRKSATLFQNLSLRGKSGVTRRLGRLLDMLTPEDYVELHSEHRIGLYLAGLHQELQQRQRKGRRALRGTQQ